MRTRFAIAAALTISACTSTPAEPVIPTDLKELPRALTANELTVRDASNRFSHVLFTRLNTAQRDTNVFVSPLSASFALGMTLNGAANQTAREMKEALQFGTASTAEINAGYRSLIALLLSLDPTVDMRVANSIWYRQGFPFHQTFFDTTSKYFGATSRALDFGDPEASLATINGWASTATNGRITKVLDEITWDHVMFLINAIYFNGSWRTRFDAARTVDAPFHAANGRTQPARLMYRSDTMAYHEGATYQAVELPYGNGAFVLNVLLPKTGHNVEDLAADIPAAALKSESYSPTQVMLHLPKLRLEYERKMNDDLRALGMLDAFEPLTADFSRLSPANGLYIDFVKQNTFVQIDERGTEAAAVTVVGIGRTSAPMVQTMRVDRPYVLVLRERLSGTILFMGKIVELP